MCVCVCVCTPVWVCVCMACMHVLFVILHVWVCACLHVCVCVLLGEFLEARDCRYGGMAECEHCQEEHARLHWLGLRTSGVLQYVSICCVWAHRCYQCIGGLTILLRHINNLFITHMSESIEDDNILKIETC